ncbi:MAG: deoxyribonuclease IV [Coxiellaceae bacterium]|jgi:deoxyribonuclease-4|nr:deoxyribonuclease IV [Coxiellaceae bacterium]
MKYFGAHISITEGIFNTPLLAKKIGAKAFACFTKNQKRWKSKQYSSDDIIKFKKNLTISKILPAHVLAHAGYLINLGNPDNQKRQISITSLISEIKNCELLGITKLVFHPGSHLRLISVTTCLDLIAEAVNEILLSTNIVELVIENTAGQGSNVGYKFEHLAYLIKKIDDKDRIGVCIDTCHLLAAGYDFRTKGAYTKMWNEFDKIIGFEYLRGLHLNDSQNELGSLKDRHESLGKGKIGFEPFKFLIQDPRFNNLPLILETRDPAIWRREIKLLNSFCRSFDDNNN